MCKRANATAFDARLVPLFPWARDLVDRLTERFCSLPVPQNDDDFAVRKEEERGMIAIRRVLLLANEWAKLTTPDGVDAISQECQTLFAIEFPTCESEHQQLYVEITTIESRIHQF